MAAGVNDTSTKPIGVRSLVEVNGSQWKSMEVNRSQWKATIANSSGGAKTAVWGMSPAIMSQFANLQCISVRIQDLRVSTGRWEVASGKWHVIQPV